MTTVALDTNVVTALLANDRKVLNKLQSVTTLFIPLTVYAELLSGVTAGANPKKYTPILKEFLSRPYIEVNSVIDDTTVEIYSGIYSYLKKQGQPVSPNDLWIAAECAQRNYPLFTLDKDFKQIPQILLF